MALGTIILKWQEISEHHQHLFDCLPSPSLPYLAIGLHTFASLRFPCKTSFRAVCNQCKPIGDKFMRVGVENVSPTWSRVCEKQPTS